MLRKNLQSCFVEQFIWAAHFLNIEMRLSISWMEHHLCGCSCYDGYSSPKCTAPCEPLWHGQQQEPGVTLQRFWKPSPVAVLFYRPGRLQCPWSSDTVGGPQTSAASPSLPLREWWNPSLLEWWIFEGHAGALVSRLRSWHAVPWMHWMPVVQSSVSPWSHEALLPGATSLWRNAASRCSIKQLYSLEG